MPEKKEEKEATVTRGWDEVEPVWFCEGLPESIWRRAAVLWGAPAVPFFRFPRAADAATILARGEAPLADEPDTKGPDPRYGRHEPWQNWQNRLPRRPSS